MADLSQELAAQDVPVQENVPTARLCSFRIGGPARWLAEPRNRRELVACLQAAQRHGIPLFLLGNGTNVLFADEGFAGLVVRLRGEFAGHSIQGSVVRAGAATPLAGLALQAVRLGLAGLQFAVGIPGTLGGGLVMNAGAHGGQLADVVLEVEACELASGRWRRMPREELGFSYRHSILQEQGWAVGFCVLGLQPGSAEQLQDQARQVLAQRQATQPLSLPNAGSVFRNPPPERSPNGWTAGRLIQEVGAKGWREGDAQVSPVHANFIVNLGHARASDVRALMARVRAAVQQRFGVALEPEIKLVSADGSPAALPPVDA
ncbi:MAG: UDP-N-acetylmuramate dehydrogenase [Firmicutes bacterium]|nr:UDP-N-acetylmuramate dehydrogenase [Bacillota bacterium]